MRKNYILGDSIENIQLDCSNLGINKVSSKFNISTYGQLLAIPAWQLRDAFDNWHDYALIRDDVHSKGYNLLGEDVMLGLFDEDFEAIVDKKINDCDLSAGLKNCLSAGVGRIHSIETIGDLLIVPYDEIRKIRNLGAGRLAELQTFVEGLGTVFYGYKIPGFDEERRKMLHSKLAGSMCLSDEVLKEGWDPNHLEKEFRKKQIENQTEYSKLLASKCELERRLNYINSKISSLERIDASENSKQYVYESKK